MTNNIIRLLAMTATIAMATATPALGQTKYYAREKIGVTATGPQTPTTETPPVKTGSKCGAFAPKMTVSGNQGLSYFVGNRTLDATDYANGKAICEATGKTFTYCAIIFYSSAACNNQGIATNGRSCLAAKIVTGGTPSSIDDTGFALASCS